MRALGLCAFEKYFSDLFPAASLISHVIRVPGVRGSYEPVDFMFHSAALPPSSVNSVFCKIRKTAQTSQKGCVRCSWHKDYHGNSSVVITINGLNLAVLTLLF